MEEYPDEKEVGRRLDEACLTYQLRSKVAVLCLPGLQSFLGDIVDFLKTRYEVRTCYSNNNQEIESAVRWADTVWLEWANELTSTLTNHSTILDGKHVICRLHSYEAFAGYVRKIRWERIDDLIFVAGHIKDIVVSQVPRLLQQVGYIHIVPNGINMNKFIFKERKKGNNIAYLGYINYKKGPMLLLHAFRELVQTDNRYRLFIAGDFQDARYKLYFDQMIREMGLEGNIQMDGWINDVGAWLADKQYIVCSSVLEGHPVSLMEAMACGLKPVIHNYVGARGSYPAKYLWNTIPEFVQKVTEDDYNSTEYREFIEQNYSLDSQLKKIEDILQPSGKVEQVPVPAASDTGLEDKLREGEGLFADGKLEEAERCFLAIAKQNPQCKEAFNNLGVIAFYRKELDKAVDFFNRSLKIDSFYKNAVLNFSDVFKELNKLHEIIPVLEKIIEKYPEDKELSELLKEARLSKRQAAPADLDTRKASANVSSEESNSLPVSLESKQSEAISLIRKEKISQDEVKSTDSSSIVPQEQRENLSEDKVKSYYNRFVEYLKHDHERPNPRHQQAKEALKQIIKPGMKVLDIGCGTGITSKFIGELGAKVVGVDISDEMISFAQKESAHQNVTYLVADAAQLDLQKQFDAITIIDSMEHILPDKLDDYLQAISRHVSENTTIYLNIPDGRYQRYMKNRHPQKLQIVDEAYAPDFVISCFNKIGFQPYRINIYGLDVPAQYNEYFFVTEDVLKNIYKEGLKKFGL